jgi:hypothetical protein
MYLLWHSLLTYFQQQRARGEYGTNSLRAVGFLVFIFEIGLCGICTATASFYDNALSQRLNYTASLERLSPSSVVGI